MINVQQLSLTFRTLHSLPLSGYAGAFWRGRIGAELRRTSCLTGAPDCRDCSLSAHCAYGMLYETPAEAVTAGPLAHHVDMPHPYIVRPCHGPGPVASGSLIEIRLTLIGPAVARSAAVLHAVHKLAARDPDIELVSHEARRPDLTLPDSLARARNWQLTLETPMRIRRGGRYLGTDSLDFGALWGALSRRLSMFHQLAHGRPLELDFAGLKAQAEAAHLARRALRWHDWSRVSGRQKQRIPMGGVEGTAVVEALPPDLLPWLWLGQFLHVGKGTVMGLGAYRMEPCT